jgi:formate dehydrogenase iron-sulfur subunit
MREEVINRKLNWLFFPEQCRHCIEARCLETAGDPGAIYRDDKTGAIIFTANTKRLNAAEIIESCPYNIPRKGPDGTLAKCDMCIDRVENGLPPACVQTCPTGAMNFGDRDEMLALAGKQLAVAKKKYPKAMLIDADDVNVIYLVAYEPKLYCKNAMASNAVFDITRQMALKRMIRPLTNIASRLL